MFHSAGSADPVRVSFGSSFLLQKLKNGSPQCWPKPLSFHLCAQMSRTEANVTVYVTERYQLLLPLRAGELSSTFHFPSGGHLTAVVRSQSCN